MYLWVGDLCGEDEVVVEVEGEQRLGQVAEEALEHGGPHVYGVGVEPFYALLGPLVQQPPQLAHLCHITIIISATRSQFATEYCYYFIGEQSYIGEKCNLTSFFV